MSSGLADYAPCTVNTNLPPPPEELLPPPSPVSSSYSELRRATQPGQSFHDYSLGSQVKMTFSWHKVDNLIILLYNFLIIMLPLYNKLYPCFVSNFRKYFFLLTFD